MLALGERLAARGHEVTFETWERWREHVAAAGMHFVPAPEYPVFPTRERPLKPYEAVVLATGQTLAAIRDCAPDVVVHDILTLAPALAGELERAPVATLIPHLHPAPAPGVPESPASAPPDPAPPPWMRFRSAIAAAGAAASESRGKLLLLGCSRQRA